jgi:8-amino-7-oxononanoate synthase
MLEIDTVLSNWLRKRDAEGLYRRRRLLQSPQGIDVVVDGRPVVNFSSNDYLGLANHPDIIKSLEAGAERYGVGSGSAHLVCGHCDAHHALEEEIAAWTGRDRALLFSTGYMANIGVISALVGCGDWVLEDRLNHASLLDGGLLSGARFKRYPHTDTAALERSLRQGGGRRALVVSDGVFSMDGDLAPLPELASVARSTGAWLVIDDAHGFGVLGETGGGTVEHYRLTQSDVPVLVGTLGKAFGTFGAFVAGSQALIEFLIQRAPPYIYTTALPPAIAEATRTSLRLVRSESWRRLELNRLIQRFREGAGALGLALMDSNTPIQPMIVGDARQTSEISARLLERGFLVGAIRPPTVPVGSARLRITLSALHGDDTIDRLLVALSETACGLTA